MTPDQIAASGTEAAHQKALFAQAATMLKQYPELKWLHAIPNGGARAESARGAMIRGADLKAQGVKAGVYDVFLPVRRGRFAGLYVEMKKPGNLKRTSPEQKEFGTFVREQGYAETVCDSWESAWQVVEQYLNWSE